MTGRPNFPKVLKSTPPWKWFSRDSPKKELILISVERMGYSSRAALRQGKRKMTNRGKRVLFRFGFRDMGENYKQKWGGWQQK